MSSKRFFYRFIEIKSNGIYFNIEALGGMVGYIYIDGPRKNMILKSEAPLEPGTGRVYFIDQDTIKCKGISFSGNPSITQYGIPQCAVQPGTIIMYAGNTEPPGWFFCNGKSLLISQYTRLYNVIGNTYSTTSNIAEGYFSLPDIRYRVVKHIDPLLTGYNSLGKTGGRWEYTLSSNNLPNHYHFGTLSSYTSNHYHRYNRDSENDIGLSSSGCTSTTNTVPVLSGLQTTYLTTSVNNSLAVKLHKHPIYQTNSNTYNVAGTIVSTNYPLNITHPSIFMNYMIKY